MRKTPYILAITALGLALVAPAVRADDYDRIERDRAELRKDTEQMHEAARDGSRKGVENEMREIQKDRAQLARDHAELGSDNYRGRHYGWRHHRHHHDWD
jgi:hypothetical protein